MSGFKVKMAWVLWLVVAAALGHAGANPTISTQGGQLFLNASKVVLTVPENATDVVDLRAFIDNTNALVATLQKQVCIL